MTDAEKREELWGYAYPRSFPFEFSFSKGNSVMPPVFHQHRKSFEINLVLSGEGYNFIEDRKYQVQPNDIYLINNFERHISVSTNHLQMKILTFSPQYLWQNSSDNLDLLAPFYAKSSCFTNLIRLPEPQLKKVHEIFQVMQEEWDNREASYQIYIKAKLMELLCILGRYLNSSAVLQDALKAQKRYVKLRPAIEYIDHNYAEPLSLQELAERCFMSKTYFSTYFKETTGMTVWEYIELVRIRQGQLLLLTTGMMVTEIAMSCGYTSLSSFNNAFKRLTRETPSAYRKKASFDQTN